MSPKRFLLLSSTSMSVALALLACSASTDKPAPAQTGHAMSSGGSGGGGTVDGGEGGVTIDATFSEAGPISCAAVARMGPTVSEESNMEQAPTAIGGPITPGIYDLTAYETWNPAAPASVPTGRTAQATIVVTATGIEISAKRVDTDAGAAAETIEAWTYSVQNTSNLVRTSVCPTAGQPSTVQFTASAGTLALFADANHREQYQIR